MSKKKKPNPPKRLRLKRPQRLVAAKDWIKSYKGKKVHLGYAKYFGVDKLCAVNELKMLGHPVSEELEAAIKQQAIARSKKPKQKAEAISEEEYWGFAYIAGYTPGGMPYGTTLEELESEDYEPKQEADLNQQGIGEENVEKKTYSICCYEDDFDLPF
jgi:hypothetical protein